MFATILFLLSLGASRGHAATVSWSEFKASTGFTPGKDVTIPAGTVVVFDGSSSDAIGRLLIHGGLACDPAEATERTLEVQAVLVQGAGSYFQCGTASSPRKAKFTIHLSGKTLSFSHTEMMNPTYCPNLPVDTMPMSDSGAQGFAVTCGARLTLVGATSSVAWTRLKSTAAPGATQLSLQQTVNWPLSSEILVTSTSFLHTEAEVRTLTGFTTQGDLILDPKKPLLYRHWGAPSKSYTTAGGVTLSLVNQAEVALLNRMILFQGTEYTDTTSVSKQEDKKAAHLMFMSNPGPIQINGVEFNTVGRMGELGHYPVHWHKVRDHLNPATGSPYDAYIKNSVIRKSFNRCITVHETNGVTLANNVCYSHYGHGFFLEEGNEQNNTFTSNLGVLSRRVPKGREILVTDVTTDSQGRYAAPATFWISNPNNTFRGNVAAGSDGTGFWFALKDSEHQPDGLSVAPSQTNLLTFSNNLAHSSRHGFSVDGGPNGSCVPNPRNNGCDPAHFDPDSGDFNTYQTNYTPSSPAIFYQVTAYKCREYGFWFRARNNNVIQNSVLADNLIGVALVFDGVLRNSVVLAKTDNFDPSSEIGNTERDPPLKPFAAALVYDGPSFLDKVHFDEYPKSMSYTASDGTTYSYTPKVFSLTVAAADRTPVHRVRALTFSEKAPKIRADFYHSQGHPSKDNWSAGVWDIDGSLTGLENYTLLPYEPMNNVPGCVTSSLFQNSLICPGRSGHVFLGSATLQFDLFRRSSDGGTTAQFIMPTGPDPSYPDLVPGAPYTDHQFSFPLSRVATDTYSVRIYEPQTVSTPSGVVSLNDLSNAVQVNLRWVDQGENSPPLEFYQMGHNCKVVGSADPAQVIVTTPDADVVKLRLMANTQSSFGWADAGGVLGQEYESSIFGLQCYVPGSVLYPSPTVDKTGCWYINDKAELISCNGSSTARFEAQVRGDRLNLTLSTGPNRGIARVSIDGGAPFALDTYATSYSVRTLTLRSGLPAGPHRLVIESTGTRNAASSGTYLVLISLSGS